LLGQYVLLSVTYNSL